MSGIRISSSKELSLSGLVVAITASRRAGELASIIRSFGGIPYIAPTVGIEVNQPLNKETVLTTMRIFQEKMDYVVFMTGPGVYSLMSSARDLELEGDLIRMLQDVQVIARSGKPKEALAKCGLKTQVMIPNENTFEGIGKLLLSLGVSGKKVYIFWHGSHSSDLRRVLENQGAQVFETHTYVYSTDVNKGGAEILKMMGYDYVNPDETRVIKLMEDIFASKVGAITFTSPPAVSRFFDIASKHGLTDSLLTSLKTNMIVVAIGPSTLKALEENNVRVDVLPEYYRMGSMIKALTDFVNSSEGLTKIQKNRS
jgi:uroporphyrinogen-III synthase